MHEPKPIQLVLQGGGAKIFALLAALEAVDQAVRDRKIRVSRIAGTSAGAIAGSLYAAGVDPQTVKEALAGFPLDRLGRFEGLWNKGVALSRALRSIPLADDRQVAAFLQRLFRARLKPGGGSVLLGDLQIPTLLVASDVSGRKRIVYDSQGDGKDRDVINCVLDSCAIPFFFRAAGKDSQVLVLDGGLCENLASELLVSGVQEYGDIVAVSFVDDAPATPRTPRELAVALLDTAINASVRRSKSAGSVFLIELDPFGVGTFDFAKAKAALGGRDAGFENARLKTARLLEELYSAQGRSRISKTRWENADPLTMGHLFDIYQSQQIPRLFRYHSRQLIIEANSLLQEGEEGYGARDLIVQTLEFSPGCEPVDCIAAQIFTDPGQKPSDVSCDVLDSENRAVPFQAVPVKDPQNEAMYGLLVCFTPPLKAQDWRFFLRTEFRIGHAFSPLEEGEPDSIGSKILRADGTADQVDLIVQIPRSFGAIEFSQDGIPGFPAEPIPAPDLWRLKRNHFNTYGWRAKNVPNGGAVKVRLRKAVQ